MIFPEVFSMRWRYRQNTELITSSALSWVKVSRDSGADLDPLREMGANLIRFNFIWEAAEPEPGVYDQSYFDYYDRVIQWAWEHGMYVLIDFHKCITPLFCGVMQSLQRVAIQLTARSKSPSHYHLRLPLRCTQSFPASTPLSSEPPRYPQRQAAAYHAR